MIFKLFLLSTLVGLASSACFDNGDKEIGGSCYKFVAQKLSFEDARNWCHYKNPVTASYLAYVPNQFTSNFLASYARSAFGTNDGSFWIGLSRKSGGSWSWDAGFPVGYTNFGDQVGQNYVAESIVNAKWNTFGASDTNFFVCGYDPAAPPTFAPQTPGPSGPTPTMRATTQQVPTTTEDPNSCAPDDLTTFLFAYSNDVNASVISSILYDFKYKSRQNFDVMANVRFDVEKEEEIHYFDNYDDFNDSINGSLPDPNLGFKDASMGSDVLKTIKKFLSNTQSTVCGCRIYLIMQRFPNETDINELVTKMRLFHVYIEILSPIVPSGGIYSSTMYNLASKTNGLCFFAYSEDFNDQYPSLPMMNPMHLAYAANVNQVSGGIVALPEFKIKERTGYFCAMTIQDHGPLDQFQYFNLTSHVVEDPSQDFNIYMNKTAVEKIYENTNHVNNWFYFGAGTNQLTLKVKYADGKPEQLQVRCYAENIDYWVPYDN